MKKRSYQYRNAQPLRDEIAEIRAYYAPIIAKIANESDFKSYLLSTDDVYTRAVLDLVERQDPERIYDEGHHIFPKCAGGAR